MKREVKYHMKKRKSMMIKREVIYQMNKSKCWKRSLLGLEGRKKRIIYM